MAAPPVTQVTSLLGERPQFTRQSAGGQLVVVRGVDAGATVALGVDAVVVGTSGACNLVLNDKAVSRRHLSVSVEDGGVVARDLDSTNGSFVGSARFRELTLGYGAEITLGETVLQLLPAEEAVEPEPSQATRFGRLLGRDLRMRRLFALLESVAATDSTVLLEGETGTGKELVAEEIHAHSARRAGPFVVFDCGAVPRELIESALFGHLKGSFTGAASDRKGAFATADGGTLFLDEIGELELELQPALLRALDKRAICPVGAHTYQKVDVRVVAATNRKLSEEVAGKRFRADLYYRLAVLRIVIPALRERLEDLPLLAESFLRELVHGRVAALTPQEVEILARHSWPGNVRELRNVAERASVLACGGRLDLPAAIDALEPPGSGADDHPPVVGVASEGRFKDAKERLVERFERGYLAGLLRRHGDNLSAAAREAGIDRKYLRGLLRKYGLAEGRGGGDTDGGPGDG